MKFQAIKGVRDILPPDSALWNRVEQTAREVFGTFGFGEIRSPILEPTELFARSIGLNTDVVSKEMYTFEDHDLRWLDLLRSNIVEDLNRLQTSPQAPRDSLIAGLNSFLSGANDQWKKGELLRTPSNAIILSNLEKNLNSISESQKTTRPDPFIQLLQDARDNLAGLELGPKVTLRPEATASVVRAYIEHGMQVQPGNVKLYYMGPMFRRERPQKGRYRQFYQIGAEVLGTSDAPGIDAEVIEMLMTLFERLKLKGTVLNINSIGDKNCRPAYVEKLREELTKVRDQLGEDSKRRIETNPLRVLDSKLEHEQPIIEKLPRVADHLCDACRAHYAEVKRQLDLRGIRYQENWRLVPASACRRRGC